MKQSTAAAAAAPWCSHAGWVSASAVVVPPAAAADLFREIWSEVADWQCHQAFLQRARTLDAARPASAPAPLVEPVVEPPRPMRARSNKAILALDDEAFIIAAYYAQLGRPPEPTGLAEMRTELARGCSKPDMLSAIHDSLEAQQWRARVRKERLTRPFTVLRRLGRSGPADGRAANLPSASPGLPAPDAWRAQVERRLGEQQAALELVTTRLDALQTAQDELAQTTRAALLEQERRLGDQAERGTSLARQITRRGDELVAATSSLSDEVGALGHRLASMAQDGVAPRGLDRGRSKAARRS